MNSFCGGANKSLVNAKNNSSKNLKVRSRSSNRADNRGTGGRKKKKPTKRR